MRVKIKFEAVAEAGEDAHDHSATYKGRMSKAAMQELQRTVVNPMVALGDAKAEAK